MSTTTYQTHEAPASVDDVTPRHLVTVDRDDLRAVATAASTDEARPVLTGVRIGEDGSLAATDSYRLHIVRDAVSGDVPAGGLLIPARDLVSVCKGPKRDGRGVTIGVGEADSDGVRAYAIARGNRTAVGLTIAGAFPNVGQLVPDPSTTVARLELLVGADLVDEVLPMFARAGRRNVPVRFTLREGGFVDLAYGGSFGRVTLAGDATPGGAVAVDVDGMGELSVGFNPAYLVDLVTSAHGFATGAPVAVELRDGFKPGTVRAGRFVGVLMPMRFA